MTPAAGREGETHSARVRQERREAQDWSGSRSVATSGGQTLLLRPPWALPGYQHPPPNRPGRLGAAPTRPSPTHPAPTWGVSGSLMQLMHCPESSAHSRTQSSKPKVASRRAASAMQPPSTLSVWPAWIGDDQGAELLEARVCAAGSALTQQASHVACLGGQGRPQGWPQNTTRIAQTNPAQSARRRCSHGPHL